MWIQMKKLVDLKVDHYFHFVVTSEETGQDKPFSKMFSYALEKAQVKPEEACMLGDNFKRDILGANQLGMDAYWLNDKMCPAPSSFQGETFYSFKQLITHD